MFLRRLAVLIPALLIFGGVLVVAACGSEEPPLPVISADSVIAYLDEVDYQESWELWPGRGEKYQGDDPHGALLTTYLNPAAFEALENKDWRSARRGHRAQGKLHPRVRASCYHCHVQEDRL